MLMSSLAFFIPPLANSPPPVSTEDSVDHSKWDGWPNPSGHWSQILIHTILKGTASSGYGTPASLVINDKATLSTVWTRAFLFCYQIGSSVPVPCYPIPEVDFESRTVLAVFLGQRGNGGYAIEIVGVKQTGSTLKVQVIATVPGAGCIVTLALNYPFHIVDIPKTEAKRIVFDVKTSVTNCSQL